MLLAPCSRPHVPALSLLCFATAWTPQIDANMILLTPSSLAVSLHTLRDIVHGEQWTHLLEPSPTHLRWRRCETFIILPI
jgi:hypothetical protein